MDAYRCNMLDNELIKLVNNKDAASKALVLYYELFSRVNDELVKLRPVTRALDHILVLGKNELSIITNYFEIDLVMCNTNVSFDEFGCIDTIWGIPIFLSEEVSFMGLYRKCNIGILDNSLNVTTDTPEDFELKRTNYENVLNSKTSTSTN
jgi:hypothetical protein